MLPDLVLFLPLKMQCLLEADIFRCEIMSKSSVSRVVSYKIRNFVNVHVQVNTTSCQSNVTFNGVTGLARTG